MLYKPELDIEYSARTLLLSFIHLQTTEVYVCVCSNLSTSRSEISWLLVQVRFPPETMGAMRCRQAVVYGVVLVSLWFVPNLAQTDANYEIPEACQGINPVNYLRIDSSDTQPMAELDLGRKLNDEDIKIIRIYSTLQVDDTIFAPGACPGGQFRPADELANGSVSLAYVYTRADSIYARTYLKIQAPIRYYSMGTLSKFVAWRAEENQILQLAVANDSGSAECWNQCNDHQKLAFIHRQVNKTLTRILQQVDRTTEYLDGTIHVRMPGDDTVFGRWPFPFGKEYDYHTCRTSLIPLSVSLFNSSTLNYTICSHWAADNTVGTWFTEELAITFNVFFSLMSCLAFYGLWPWFCGVFYRKALIQARTRFPAPEEDPVDSFTARNVVEGHATVRKYLRNGQFPNQLSIGYLLRAEHRRNSELPWSISTLPSKLLLLPHSVNACWYVGLLMVCAVGIVYFMPIGFRLYFHQPFDSNA